MTNIINSDLKRNAFSDSAEVASIRPIFKGKGEGTEIKNYRPVNILNYLQVMLLAGFVHGMSPLTKFGAHRYCSSRNVMFYFVTWSNKITSLKDELTITTGVPQGKSPP